ncbi:MAG: hypothetical protein NZ889_01595 [Candidatus Pacearchaeota archaeon]|nr:hypothetical protein [Candidatus Pacearchaeota archaeon]
MHIEECRGENNPKKKIIKIDCWYGPIEYEIALSFSKEIIYISLERDHLADENSFKSLEDFARCLNPYLEPTDIEVTKKLFSRKTKNLYIKTT